MTILEWVLTGYFAICVIYWVINAYASVRTRQGLRPIEESEAPEPASWPTVSVVVPACNEVDKLADAFRTLLAQDYPALEIVLVEDRSTDGTAELADRLGAEDARVRVVHVTELPEGWLGKVHALDRGLSASSGEIVLFTDADVHFTPMLLRRAVAYLLDEELDHLALFPSMQPTPLIVDAMIGVSIRQLITTMRPWGMRDKRAKSCLGVGAFNMIRRSAFERTEGFAWMRMETADDVTLAYMMKRSGARGQVGTAFKHLSLTWYRSLREAAAGAEKGFSSVFRCRLSLTIVAALVMLALESAPILALVLPFCGHSLVVWSLAGMTVTLFVFTALQYVCWAHARPLALLGGPAAAPVLAAIAIRVGVLGRRQGGLVWRGRLYPSSALRAGRRVPL